MMLERNHDLHKLLQSHLARALIAFDYPVGYGPARKNVDKYSRYRKRKKKRGDKNCPWSQELGQVFFFRDIKFVQSAYSVFISIVSIEYSNSCLYRTLPCHSHSVPILHSIPENL